MSAVTGVLTREAKGHLTTVRQCGPRDRNEEEAAVMLTTAATMKTEVYDTVHSTGTEGKRPADPFFMHKPFFSWSGSTWKS